VSDYEAISIEHVANASDDLEIAGVAQRIGAVSLRGLPFEFAGDEGLTRIVRLSGDRRVVVPLVSDRPSTTITVAHRVSSMAGPGAGTVGRTAAMYRFTYADGESVSVAIREGFEVGAPWLGDRDHWGLRPSLAVPDERDRLPHRDRGEFADIGRRQTEVVEAGWWLDDTRGHGQSPGAWRFYLWSWLNPNPLRPVVEVELCAGATTVDVAGLCLGFADEHPLRPEPARIVVADIPPSVAADPGLLAIEVDRGTAGYTSTLSSARVDQDPLSAWGDHPGEEPRLVYARVSALDSATVRLVAGDSTFAEARWSDLRAKAPTNASLRVTEHGRNWVRTRFVDDASGEAVACRVSFATPDGVPFQPHGHHHHVNSDLGSWHSDVGGDVRLGGRTYAYVDGGCEGWLPYGPVRLQVARGFDYEPVDDVLTVDESTRQLTVRLRRLFDPAREGWYSGDTHVHFLSTHGGLLEGSAEGVSVINLLQSQWGSLFTNIEDFVGGPVTSKDGQTIVYTSQENRQHFLGHLSLLGLKEPVMPWSTDGASEAEMGSGLEATLSDWADRCHAQGGITVVPHFPVPSGELATLVATERIDALELAELPDRAYREYYRYLNAGFSLPLAGGTDKMSSDVPVGLSRTFVQLPEGSSFNFDAWCAGLKAGRSYVSSGPLLELNVDGAGIGDRIVLPQGGGTLAVSARARSIFPIFNLELIWCGRVIASVAGGATCRELRLNEEFVADHAGWLCVRVGGAGPEAMTRHRDLWQREIVAHSSPVYVECGDQRYMTDMSQLDHIEQLIERGRSYITGLASWDSGSDVRHHHHHDHQAYLLRPFDEAKAAIARKRDGAT
jgi:hypothetical protein